MPPNGVSVARLSAMQMKQSESDAFGSGGRRRVARSERLRVRVRCCGREDRCPPPTCRPTTQAESMVPPVPLARAQVRIRGVGAKAHFKSRCSRAHRGAPPRADCDVEPNPDNPPRESA